MIVFLECGNRFLVGGFGESNKDLSLNITEEVGEFWGLIKWIDDEKQKEPGEAKP